MISMSKKLLSILCVFLMSVVVLTPLHAQPLPEPGSRTVLTVSGLIGNTNGPGVARFDRAMLGSLPQHTIRTTTPWFPGITEFSGPLLADVLALVKARGTVIKASALNDYSVIIPASDAVNHQVVLATTLNGKPMSVREKGPVFIVYPFDTKAELRSTVYYERAIWQLKSIELK